MVLGVGNKIMNKVSNNKEAYRIVNKLILSDKDSDYSNISLACLGLYFQSFGSFCMDW